MRTKVSLCQICVPTLERGNEENTQSSLLSPRDYLSFLRMRKQLAELVGGEFPLTLLFVLIIDAFRQ